MEATSNPYQTPASNMDTVSGNTAHTRLISMSGRISRMRYMAWSFILGLILAVIGGAGAMLAISAGGAGGNGFESSPLFAVVVVITSILAIPAVILGIGWGRRRLNDVNRSGWLLLLFLIPLVNLVMTIYLVLAKGTPGDNNFGPPPPENSTAVNILGTLYIILMVGGLAFDLLAGIGGLGLSGGQY